MKLLLATLQRISLIINFLLQKILLDSFSEPQNVYWGPGEQPTKVDESIRKFKIEFSEEIIQDLKQRLTNTRKMQPSFPNISWVYGMNSEYVPVVVDYWLKKYDFKKREDHLNRYPQYLTNIQGLDIHFYHIKPKLPKDRKINVLPLLIVHGWPGSVVEFQKIIPLLTTPRSDQDFVFQLVVPSLPGFGYSSPSTKAGLDSLEIGVIFKKLMLRLGYEKFYVQGGDFGSIITSHMASIYPNNVLGLHSNMCFTLNPLTWSKILVYSFTSELFSKDNSSSSNRKFSDLATGLGYFYMQSTKPDSIGVAMSDSPAGLAAYILEKFCISTNSMYKYRMDGGLTEKLSMDELIDNLMLYWAPNKATTSFRLYAQFLSSQYIKYRLTLVPIKVPSACALFPNEPLSIPKEFLRERYENLVRVKKMPRGGHFAAMEEPKLLADDIFASVKKMVKTKN